MRNLGSQRKKFTEKPHPLIEWGRKQDIRSWRQTRRNGYFSIKNMINIKSFRHKTSNKSVKLFFF